MSNIWCIENNCSFYSNKREYLTSIHIIFLKTKVILYSVIRIYSLIIFVLYPFENAQAKVNKIDLFALEPYNLVYDSSYNGINFEATRSLKENHSIYTLKTTAKNILGTINEETIFEIDLNGNIAETKYQSTKSILGIKKQESLIYDKSLGIAKYQGKSKKRNILKQDAHLNNLTLQVKLHSDLLQKTSSLSYSIIRKGKVTIYQFEILGEEVIKTKLGNINTVKIKKTRAASNRETFLWFAPSWNFLLVKLTQKEADSDYTMLLKGGKLKGIKLEKYNN